MEIKSNVKSADRIIEIFEILAQHNNGLSHQALADALNIPKSSLTQLLRTALTRGFVSYTPRDRRYQLGERLFKLAKTASRTQDLVALSMPILQELTEKSRESSGLTILKGNQTEIIATIHGPERLVTKMGRGDLAPLYATSGGKIILAYMPDTDQRDYIANTRLERFTPNTILDAGVLRRTLEEARRSGVARSFEEFTPGIIGIAHAVLSNSGNVVAAINIAMPAVRYTEERQLKICELLRDACTKLQARLSE